MNLGIAISIAAKCFENKTDKAGEPYMLHCIRVMNNLHTNDNELKTIAMLHDTVEDKVITQKELSELFELGYYHLVVKV